MIQLIESSERIGSIRDANISEGQAIEHIMAQNLGLKVFQVYRPTNKTGCEFKFHSRHL